jgi:hypothetical protein
MSAIKTPVKSEDALQSSPTKLLLHEKDGSTFPRDVIGNQPIVLENSLKIISWNVAGLRGTLKKSPEVLNDLVDRHKPDLLCLQVKSLPYSYVYTI